MLKKQRTLLLGPISPPVSGPGIKNKMLLDWLHKQKELQVDFLNTYDFRKFKFKKIFSSLIAFLKCKKVVLSVSKNGRFLLIPICVIFRKKIFLFPAGGSFDIEINNLPPLIKSIFMFFCNHINATFVQTKQLQAGLEKLNFSNIFFLPNPRINMGHKVTISPTHDQFNVVFLSKIREVKGPLILIDAINKVREIIQDINFKVDFYGVVDSDFQCEFEEKLRVNNFCSYKGVSRPEEVQENISKYNLFVLPTYYAGEGVPGAVIDAMFTGIPIIISDFTAAKEIINDGIDGIIVPKNEIDPLVEAIIKVASDFKFRKNLSKNILSSSRNYDYDNLMDEVKKYLIS